MRQPVPIPWWGHPLVHILSLYFSWSLLDDKVGFELQLWTKLMGEQQVGNPWIGGGRWEIKGQEAGEERAGNGSSKKVRIIYYTFKYIQKQEPKMFFDLLILRLLAQSKKRKFAFGLKDSWRLLPVKLETIFWWICYRMRVRGASLETKEKGNTFGLCN